MKKKFTFTKKVLTIGFAVIAATGLLAGCSSSDSDDTASVTSDTEINVISREEGSGTRGAFVELFGIEVDDEDLTTSTATIANSTGVVISTVAEDAAAIGYISLGSLDDSVTALTVDGVEATTENIQNDTYAVYRPFNIATSGDVSDAAQAFIDYIMSAEGQAIIEEEGYIAVDTDADSYAGSDVEGEVTISGSSSVSPVMEVLIEAYEDVNPNISIELTTSDSTTGMTNVIDGVSDIGMASRELKDSELEEGLEATVIANDGLAIVINPDNDLITDITSDQVYDIFTGAITTWGELSE